jgi:hypothetical protein
MSWKLRWRDKRDPYKINSITSDTLSYPDGRFQALAKQFAEIANVMDAKLQQTFDNTFSDRFTEISFAQPPPSIQGELPMDDIADGLSNGMVIPFLGAGVPLSGRADDDVWEPNCGFLPSSIELATHLAKGGGMPVWNLRDIENLARVASYYSFTNQQVTIGAKLSAIFGAKVEPTKTHKFLASLPKRFGHKILIVTTNYDRLMEQALDDAGCEYDRVINCGRIDEKCSVLVQQFPHKTQIPVNDDELSQHVNLETRTILYKMHGSIDTVMPPELPQRDRNEADSRFVITEEHYVDFLSRINAAPPAVPNLMKKYFDERCFLFLGYSLDDWNLRVILHSLQATLKRNAALPKEATDIRDFAEGFGVPPPKRRHWSIQRNPTQFDQAVWRGRNVTIANLDLTEFVNRLNE